MSQRERGKQVMRAPRRRVAYSESGIRLKRTLRRSMLVLDKVVKAQESAEGNVPGAWYPNQLRKRNSYQSANSASRSYRRDGTGPDVAHGSAASREAGEDECDLGE